MYYTYIYEWHPDSERSGMVWEGKKKNKKSLFQYNYDDGMIGMLFGEHKHIHLYWDMILK